MVKASLGYGGGGGNNDHVPETGGGGNDPNACNQEEKIPGSNPGIANYFFAFYLSFFFFVSVVRIAFAGAQLAKPLRMVTSLKAISRSLTAALRCTQLTPFRISVSDGDFDVKYNPGRTRETL